MESVKDDISCRHEGPSAKLHRRMPEIFKVIRRI